MFWNDVSAEVLPVLSSPKPNQVSPTLTMPSPCNCRVLPFWSVRSAPVVNVTEAACACVAGTSRAARPPSRVRSVTTVVRHRGRGGGVRCDVVSGMVSPLR